MESKKKVGILTYYDTYSNYGQVLQNAALQYVLRQMGYAPVTIRFDLQNVETVSPTFSEKIKYFVREGMPIARFFKRRMRKHIGHNEISLKKYTTKFLQESRDFDTFRAKHITLSEKQYLTIEDLDTLSTDNYSAFIVGSDQVWHKSNEYSPARQYAFMLSFANNERRIAYAASAGRTKIIAEKEKRFYISELPKFHAVSCRESECVEICKSLGRKDATVVLDPTLLLEKSDWLRLLNISERSKRAKSIFIYSLKNNDYRIDYLYRYFSELGYEINYVCSASHKDALANKEDSVADWIQDIMNAEIVITNSFHGTVFSILFHSRVISLANEEQSLTTGANARMYSILSELGIENLLVKSVGNIKTVLTQEIDWESIDNKIRLLRTQSLNFLKKTLS